MPRLFQHVSSHWILDLWVLIVFDFIFIWGISFINSWVYTFLFIFLAEQLYLATLKLWWCVVTARQFYASLLVVELDSPKDALSGKRVTKSNGYDWKKSFDVVKCLNFSSNVKDLERLV